MVPLSIPRLPLTLLTTLLLAFFLLLSTGPTAVKAGEFDIGEVCGKLNGDGYVNNFMCSRDRKSVITCTSPSPTILPTWQLARACHSDHYCYALQTGAERGKAPMEPNGYPSDDSASFGCRKLLGPEDQPKEKGGVQKVVGGGTGGGLRKRDGGRERRAPGQGGAAPERERQVEMERRGEREEGRRWVA